MDNLAPTLAYTLDRAPLFGEAKRVLSELNSNGIAITSVDALLGNDSCYEELKSTVAQLERDLKDEIAGAREETNKPGFKSYIHWLLGRRPVLDPGDIFVRFALQRRVLNIANAYLGMYSALYFYNVWHNFATQSPARDSQLWHYDTEDNHILKVFVYLSDVDENSGPLFYAAGSHLKGNLRGRPDSFKQDGVRRSEDWQMAEFAPRDRWVQALGEEGTMVFADVRGYHKGGLARDRDRIAYICAFTSPSRKAPEHFERSQVISTQFDRPQAYALAGATVDKPFFRYRRNRPNRAQSVSE